MRTLKLFSLTLTLSLAGLVYASGGAAQSPSQTKDAAPRASCCVAGAECCKAGADCCKADKGCCAGGVCNMKEHAAHHASAPASGQHAASHGGHHRAAAQSGEKQACPLDGSGCCEAQQAEGQTADCCKLNGEAAHAAHAQAAGGGGEKARASCRMMHKPGGTSDAKARASCCAGGAECCKAGAACCAAVAKGDNKQ